MLSCESTLIEVELMKILVRICVPGELDDAEKFINFLRKNKCLNKYKSLISAVFWDDKEPDFKNFFGWLFSELEQYHMSDVELTEDLVFVYLVKTYLFNNYEHFINPMKYGGYNCKDELTKLTDIIDPYCGDHFFIFLDRFFEKNYKLILNNPEKLFIKFTNECLVELFFSLSVNMMICKLTLDENKLKRKKFFKKSLIAYASIKKFHKLLYIDLVNFIKSKSVCSNPSDLT